MPGEGGLLEEIQLATALGGWASSDLECAEDDSSEGESEAHVGVDNRC
jgi:hypothetical protein